MVSLFHFSFLLRNTIKMLSFQSFFLFCVHLSKSVSFLFYALREFLFHPLFLSVPPYPPVCAYARLHMEIVLSFPSDKGVFFLCEGKKSESRIIACNHFGQVNNHCLPRGSQVDSVLLDSLSLMVNESVTVTP